MDAFSSNDPLQAGPLPYASITDPRSLNKYGYTYNNPLRYTDPTGHCPECQLPTRVPTPPPGVRIPRPPTPGAGGAVAGGLGATLVRGTVGAVVAVAATGVAIGVAGNILINSFAAVNNAEADRVMQNAGAANDALIRDAGKGGTKKKRDEAKKKLPSAEPSNEHTKNKRPSTQNKHEKNRARQDSEREAARIRKQQRKKKQN